MSYEITFNNVSSVIQKQFKVESERERFLNLWAQYHQQHCKGIWGTVCFKH